MLNNDENVPPEEEQRENSTSQSLFVALLNDNQSSVLIKSQLKEKWPEIKPL
jgi:hypothetical protein